MTCEYFSAAIPAVPAISFAPQKEEIMNCTASTREINVGEDPERIVGKVAPTLEVVTNCGLDGQLYT